MRYQLLLFIMLTVFVCCKRQSQPLQETPNLIDHWLAERVASVISVDEDIVVRFKSGLEIDDGATGTTDDIIRFSPKLNGSFVWADGQTLIFHPDNILEYDQPYSMNIDLSKISQNDITGATNLTINFRTKSLHMNMQDITHMMSANGEEVEVQISGSILSNQYVNEKTVEGALKVSADSNTEVSWTHGSRGSVHDFIIRGINQNEKSQDISIEWYGGKAFSNFRGEKIVSIAGQKYFTIDDIILHQSPNRHIVVLFSQPLNEGQDLKGFIKIDNKIIQPKTLIDGNQLKIYPDGQLSGVFALHISRHIQSFKRDQLDKDFENELNMEPVKPQLRLAESGIIVPPNKKLTFPFEAINIDTVDMEIFKIYDQNVLQFLQTNEISGTYNLEHVGKVVYREKITLQDGGTRVNTWNSFGLDLQDYFLQDNDAIYQVRLGFRPSYVAYSCDETVRGFEEPDLDGSIMDYRYHGYEGWDDPCSLSYYTSAKYVSRNVVLSNVAAIIKRDYNHNFHIAVTSLHDGGALSGAAVTFYDAQKIEMTQTNTNEEGMVQIQMDHNPSFAVVRHMEGVAYLDLRDAGSLSLTDFNTDGKKSKDGVDAFIYTDRGVYRPGDTVFMHVMVEDGEIELPDDHPVTLSVKDAQGQLKFKYSTHTHIDHVYRFDIPTDVDDPTGAWYASIQIGAAQFSKRLRVETIKPNRLRLALSMDDRISYVNNESRIIEITSSWLHGAPASNLRTKIDAQWSTMSPDFDDYKNFIFIDPARQHSSGQVTLYDGKLNESGKSSFQLKLDKKANFPAMLRANITNRVFEEAGDFSESYGSLEVSPYSTYVGISMQKDRWGSPSIKIGDKANAEVVVVDEGGRPISKRRLSIGVYDIDWQWWYYRGQRANIYQLNSDTHNKAILKSQSISGVNGRVSIPIVTDDMEYGRKLIRVCDLESGHCTGQFFYASAWGSSLSSEERNSLTRLTFTSDKASYKTGDEVTLNIPSEEGSNILISIESEDRVIMQDWLEGASRTAQYKFGVDRSMAPNVYAHVSLIQPYDQITNDLPIRMYGVIPIMVEDPESTITPRIETPVEIKPEEEFSITVSEEEGRAMTYTINIVDEGLLDLTNYKTPSPHDYFYAKRSLGVKTWDIYDDVLYGLNGIPDKIISIGGDGEIGEGKGQKKAIRFEPVVFSAGPFRLAAGAKGNHMFRMPNYIGSVRTMVVARHDQAYGKIDVATPVKTPLMLLPTVPRVISQGERIKIPVSVFAMQDDIHNVEVELGISNNLTANEKLKKLSFNKQGEQVTYFDALVGDEMGIAKIDVRASSGGYKTSQQIEVDIRNPNPIVTQVVTKVLQGGESWSPQLEVFGVHGTNKGIIELSTLPAIRLADRVGYLVNYPYGCLEQATSSAFAQLYLKDLTDYVSDSDIDRNIKAGIKRIAKLQSASGGFKYWPSPRSHINAWATSYAGHFLMEAKDKGYYVADDVLNRWVKDQQKRAANSKTTGFENEYHRRQALLGQGYRLYTLALHGSSNLSAMNILRSQSDLPSTSRFLLAAAYAISSKSKIALDLIEGTNTNIKTYRDRGITYGSEVRDMALIAEALKHLDRKSQSLEIIKKIADKLNSNRWYSTQSVAFGLMSVGKLAEEFRKSKISASVIIGDSPIRNVTYDKSIFTMLVDPDSHDNNHMFITNKSNKGLFVSYQLSGQKGTSTLLTDTQVADHVAINVNYKNLDGSPIDISRIVQGTDFIAEVNVSNLNTLSPTLEEMALTQIIPSGWEIRSGRLNQVQGFTQDGYDYRDIRDDRVHTFFDLGSTKKYALLLNATYEGDYFLPPVQVEAMYDKSVSARTKGRRVSVVGR